MTIKTSTILLLISFSFQNTRTISGGSRKNGDFIIGISLFQGNDILA